MKFQIFFYFIWGICCVCLDLCFFVVSESCWMFWIFCFVYLNLFDLKKYIGTTKSSEGYLVCVQLVLFECLTDGAMHFGSQGRLYGLDGMDGVDRLD